MKQKKRAIREDLPDIESSGWLGRPLEVEGQAVARRTLGRTEEEHRLKRCIRRRLTSHLFSDLVVAYKR